MKKHECIVGIKYDYDNTYLVTLEELKDNINNRKKSNEYIVYELKDYFDKRKSTDVEMFTYCPICGKKIEYKGE